MTPPKHYLLRWPTRGLGLPHQIPGKTLANSDDVAGYLVKEAGVVTASGLGFMQDGYLRLSFAAPDETIVEGMKATRAALSQLT